MKNYSLLGKSGLRVSPLGLGTMTFGTEWGWGMGLDACHQVFDAYLEGGGNWVDTAINYTSGVSEEILGQLISERKVRDRIVLSTKFSFSQDLEDPNAGGNGRKNIFRSLEKSLKRLRTDYIDLYWLHTWDRSTPVEEVMKTLDSLVQSGKVRYVGLSNCPSWYVSRAQTLAELRGWERISALQLEYNLTERSLELEFIDLARELGLGLCIWSPLANGFLTQKQTKGNLEGRLRTIQGSGNPTLEKYAAYPRNWEILDLLRDVAAHLGKSPAQVAIGFIARRPGVTSTLIGATSLSQLQENMGALDFDIPSEFVEKLEAATRPLVPSPYCFFESYMQTAINGRSLLKR